jgi:transcriptional regulator with XRE-family HTH domain
VRWKEDREKCRNRSIPLPYLQELRQSQGLSQRDLGRLAKVSSGTVYRLENGLRGAYPGTVRKLASALEVSPAELVRGHLREKKGGGP